MSAEMIEELHNAAGLIGNDPDIRAVILGAVGRSFCAGADLGWMRSMINAGAIERRRESLKLAQMLNRWGRLPKPTIGKVQGNAFGGGIGLMSVCDICLVAASAEFAFSEVRLGLIPATISPYVIAKIGAAPARRHFISGKRFDACEAVTIGLATKAVEPARLDSEARREAEEFLCAAPEAVAEAKALTWLKGGGGELIQQTADRLTARWETAEAAEGISAFFERRNPDWMQVPESRAE